MNKTSKASKKLGDKKIKKANKLKRDKGQNVHSD